MKDDEEFIFDRLARKPTKIEKRDAYITFSLLGSFCFAILFGTVNEVQLFKGLSIGCFVVYIITLLYIAYLNVKK